MGGAGEGRGLNVGGGREGVLNYGRYCHLVFSREGILFFVLDLVFAIFGSLLKTAQWCGMCACVCLLLVQRAELVFE